ncbi:acetyltransferase [Methylobacterium longum]|uniref:Acetyltransferase n=1 Tax=Methylobacterium longum TaxID=767694 RepID=A0ABT8AVQ5_9HYPH|nr:acetyltransferase [Methylobacterium longum]MDN3573966.1 acetyltransferase [Methylobacterium longum]GJE14759.1 2,3,4,5-tetrahydropyridine-2,6-dicarboxylate N-acetyltransferase [Methylobacterium longum]
MSQAKSQIERLVLFGAGALAREILVVLSRLHAVGHEIEFVACLVDPDIAAADSLHDRPVSRDIHDFAGDDSLRFVVALGEPKARARAVERLRSIGARFASIIDPAVLIGASSSVGEGSMILGHASITADAHLGAHVLVNPGSTIAHDNRIDDFATLSPGVNLAGHVIIEEGAFLGTGASVIPGIRIGAHALVGAGAVVIRDVLPGHRVVGNPARILRRG